MDKLTIHCKCGRVLIEPATEIHVRCPECSRVYNRIDAEEFKHLKKDSNKKDAQ